MVCRYWLCIRYSLCIYRIAPFQDFAIIAGLAKTGPIGMIWGGVVGAGYIALQAIAILPTKRSFTRNGVRRSFFNTSQTLIDNISVTASKLLIPAFVGYLIGVFAVLIIATINKNNNGQIGLGAFFFYGPVGMLIGGIGGFLNMLRKHFKK